MEPYGKRDYWLDNTDYDLQTAKAMLGIKCYLYVGFMCHQTIEKALKGILFYKASERGVTVYP